MLAGQSYINTGTSLPCPTFVFALPSRVHLSGCQTASLLRPLQSPPMGTGDKSDKKGTDVCVRLLFFFFLFAPLRAITIHRITGSRNNNPQVDLCWKWLDCNMKNGKSSAFLCLNGEQGGNMRSYAGALRWPCLWYTFQICFNFRVQMELVNDRMLLESQRNKSFKVGRQRISSEGTPALVGFCKDILST